MLISSPCPLGHVLAYHNEQTSRKVGDLATYALLEVVTSP